MKQKLIIELDVITGRITVDWGELTLPEILGYLELAKALAITEFNFED